MASPLWKAQDFPARSRPVPAGGPGLDCFTTIGLAAPDRVARWEEHNERTLLGLECRDLDGRPLEARELTFRLPELKLAGVTANRHVVERTRAEIDRSRVDGVALYFSLFGESFFYHENGVLLQRPGTLLVTDVSRPFLRGFARGLEEYVLTVPRALFEEVAERPLPSSPLTLGFADAPGGDAHAAELARLVRATLADPQPARRDATQAQALELLRAMLSADGAHSAPAYRRTALAYIDRHLREPGLSVAKVAEAVGVSERHLARAFGETGTGVARTILERRLELAHRLLSEPGAAQGPQVSQVAESCGFVSAAHFSRVFRERYEIAPSELRSASRSAWRSASRSAPRPASPSASQA